MPPPRPGDGTPAPPGPPATVDPAELRRLVLAWSTSERRRHPPPVLHVGREHRLRRTLVLGCDDDAVRADVLTALVEPVLGEEVPPMVWLARAGDVAETRLDAAWHRAARRVGAEVGVPLPFAVLTRRGWRTPATGASRTWSRLRESRPRGRAAGRS